MKAIYQGEGFSISEECAKSQDAFAFLSMCKEVFTHQICLFGGKNGKACGKHAKFVHRISGGYPFFEMKCSDSSCGAVFKFGQQTKERGGQLFPKYKDDQGNLIEDYGWHKDDWTQKQQQEDNF